MYVDFFHTTLNKIKYKHLLLHNSVVKDAIVWDEFSASFNFDLLISKKNILRVSIIFEQDGCLIYW